MRIISNRENRMKYFKFLLVLLSLFLISCTDVQNGEDGTDGSDGENGQDGTDTTTDTVTIYNPTGKVQGGPCLAYGDVHLLPLNPQLKQVAYHRGKTKDNSGAYDIPANITTSYGQYYFNGDCRNEINNATDTLSLEGLIKFSDGPANISLLTSIQSLVAWEYFQDSEHPGYNDPDLSLTTAKTDILNYVDMPDTGMEFYEMSLEGDSTGDAVLTLINSVIANGRNGPEQGDYLAEIAQGVINNDLVLKAEIISDIDALPIMTIINNLKSIYEALDITPDTPPIWIWSPVYYADLLENPHSITGTQNLDDTGSCSFDQSTFNNFAIPHVFDSAIETSKYIALNLQSVDISIWTRDASNDIPETKLVDIEELAEPILDSTLSYHGMLPDAHGLTGGTDYYIVLRSDTDFTLSTACGNASPFFLPFGRKLARDEDGANVWEGNANNTGFWRKLGIKVELFD